MTLNTYALGILAADKIREIARESQRDRLATEATNAGRSGQIGSAVHMTTRPRAATRWMIAAWALLGFASLIGRDASRVRSPWGD